MKVIHSTVSSEESVESVEYETDKVIIHRGMDGVMVDLSDITIILGRLDKVIVYNENLKTVKDNFDLKHA
jgi:hypothetical protein